jgi:excisionase family DNA binding protein
MTDAIEPIKGLTVKEAAFILGVSPITIYGWCRNGKIQYFKIMGNIRIREQAIKAIADSTQPTYY